MLTVALLMQWEEKAVGTAPWSCFDDSLRWVRDRWERPKQTNEIATRGNVWPRHSSWARTRWTEGSPARRKAPIYSIYAASHWSKAFTRWAGPIVFDEFSNSSSPLKKIRMSEKKIQTSETIQTLDKKEKDWHELRAKLEENKAMTRELDEWKKKYNELQITCKEEETKHLKELYIAKVGQISPEVLKTMNSDGSKDASSRTKTQELFIHREHVAHTQTPQCASSHRNTIPDPSDTYMAPQFQESFNQVARAAMNEINGTSGRT